MNYSSFPAPAPGWQMGPPHGMGISVQHNNLVVLLKSKLSASNLSSCMASSNSMMYFSYISSHCYSPCQVYRCHRSQ